MALTPQQDLPALIYHCAFFHDGMIAREEQTAGPSIGAPVCLSVCLFMEVTPHPH